MDLWADAKPTLILVTHDVDESIVLADRVVVMNAGTIEQLDTPNGLYHHPRTRFVAGFIGSPAMNFMTCRLAESAGALSIHVNDELSFPVPASRTARYKSYANRELVFGLRPEHIIEARGTSAPGHAEFEVPVDVVEPMGMETLVYFTVNGTEVCARVNPAAAPNAGETARLSADLNQMHLIDPENDLVI